jgi:hypothetical protein
MKMIECACLCEDGDRADPYTIFEPTARKEHLCHECGASIKPGEKYHLFKGKFPYEGWVNYKTCLFCISIVRDFTCGYCFGNLWHDLICIEWPEYQEIPEDEIRAMVPDYIWQRVMGQNA